MLRLILKLRRMAPFVLDAIDTAKDDGIDRLNVLNDSLHLLVKQMEAITQHDPLAALKDVIEGRMGYSPRYRATLIDMVDTLRKALA